MSQTKATLIANEWKLISRPRAGRKVSLLPPPSEPARDILINTVPDIADAYQLTVTTGWPIGYLGIPVLAADSDDIWIMCRVAASVVVVER